MADINNLGSIKNYEQPKPPAANPASTSKAQPAVRQPAEKSPVTETGPGQDRVEISRTSQELQTARNAANQARLENTPEDDAARQAKVAQLKEDIAQGRYEVDPEKIAGKIMSEITGA